MHCCFVITGISSNLLPDLFSSTNAMTLRPFPNATLATLMACPPAPTMMIDELIFSCTLSSTHLAHLVLNITHKGF